MTREDSLEFRKLVRAVAGMTGKEPSSLLSSLPCELAFNDLRDSSRRHQKMEKTCPQNLHAVSYKSSLVRTCGCKTLPLSDSDWATMMNVKAVKKTVFSSLRSSDIQLGVSSEGLTRHKRNAEYTKPHVFCNRLRLLETLKGYYLEQSGDADERRAKVISAHRSLWLSRLIPTEALLRFKTQDDDQNPAPPMLVIRAGPHSILGVAMDKISDDPATFTFPSLSPARREQLVLDHTKVEICATQPVISEVDGHCLGSGSVLSWQERGPWRSLVDWVAEVGILTITAQLLTALCSRLKIPGHSKLNHKLKVELFLRFLGKSEEYVNDVLLLIPEKPARKRNSDDDASGCEDL